MNHPNHRSLAYQLATIIPEDTLENIAGGGSDPFGISMHHTLKATGDSAQGADVHYDVSFDC